MMELSILRDYDTFIYIPIMRELCQGGNKKYRSDSVGNVYRRIALQH